MLIDAIEIVIETVGDLLAALFRLPGRFADDCNESGAGL